MGSKGHCVAAGGVAAMIVALAVHGCGGGKNPWNPQKTPHVLASFPPIYCFVANVIDPKGEVQTLMVGKEPHHYDPSIQDAWLLRDANLFFINGLGLDDAAADRALNSTTNSNLKTVRLGEQVPPKELITVAKTVDPHVWLGLPEAIWMVDAVRDALKAAVPERGKVYDANADAYIARLKTMYEDGKVKLRGVKNRKIIAFHDSLRYFARAFDLDVAGVVEWQPGQAPSSQEVQELIRICKEQNVRVLVSEPLYDRTGTEAHRLLQMLQNAGIDKAVVVEIDPLETAPPGREAPPNCDRERYEQVMQSNIDKLAKALR